MEGLVIAFTALLLFGILPISSARNGFRDGFK